MGDKIIKIGNRWIDITAIIAISETGVVMDLPPAKYGFFEVWMRFRDKTIEFYGNREEVEKQHSQILDEWQKHKQGEEIK